jgi:hypothetical protein
VSRLWVVASFTWSSSVPCSQYSRTSMAGMFRGAVTTPAHQTKESSCQVDGVEGKTL